MHSFRGIVKHAECLSEAAVVLKLDMNNKDVSTRHIVATFPTEIFTGDRTDQGGEMHCWLKHQSAPR